jgi:hypothetical protein
MKTTKMTAFTLVMVIIITHFFIGSTYSSDTEARSDNNSGTETFLPPDIEEDEDEDTKDPLGVDYWLDEIPSRNMLREQQGGGSRSGDNWDISLIKYPNSYSYIIYPKISVANNSGYGNTITLIVACYDTNGRLTDTTSSSIFIDDSEEKILSAKLVKPYSTNYSKVYLWDENFIPICTEFTFLSEATDIIGIPQNLTIAAITDTTVDLRWDSVCGSSSYSIDCFGNITNVGKVSSTKISGLIPHTEYIFKIRSQDVDNISSNWCSPVSITTMYSAPTGLEVSSTSKTGIVLSWDYLSDAEG